MAGLYIHIPFCKSRCIYCGFYSSTLLASRQRYVDAVCREMEMRTSDAAIHTIYIGGGTPSQLSMPQLQQLFAYINKVYDINQDAEITIEVNPDDVTEAFAEGLKSLPINRVSMGVQTFDDQRLRFLNRRHTSAQIPEAIRRLRQAGIGNLSIDLMYGFPQETLDEWENDIRQALALGAEHLSAYCLTYEEDTPLYRLLTEGKIQETDEELERQMFYTLKHRLEDAGYEHYEISNYALPNRYARHNSNYWNATPYIGLGAAAHSYDGNCRSWNVSDLQTYMNKIEQGQLPSEHEETDEQTRYNDLVTTALRTRKGLDLRMLSPTYIDYCRKTAEPLLQ